MGLFIGFTAMLILELLFGNFSPKDRLSNALFHGFLGVIAIWLLNQNKIGNVNDSFKESAINALIKQAARWSTAASQDLNPFIANLHANYGQGYNLAVSDIASEQDITTITGVDFRKFKQEISNIQDMAAKKLVNACPGSIPKNKFLAEIGGEG